MDLAKWANRTSPKFTRGVKYQFHHGLTRSEIRKSQSSFSPYIYIYISYIYIYKLYIYIHIYIIIIRVFCPKAGSSLKAEKPRLQFCRRQVFHCKLRNQECSFTKIPSKTAALVTELAVEDLPSAELQPRFFRLQ